MASPRPEMCRYCRKLPAVSGAFCFPLDPPQNGKLWAFTMLCLAHGVQAVARGAHHIYWRPQPGEEAMGKVAAELRGHHQLEVISSAAHRVFAGARAELRRRGYAKPTREEIASEAVEAAEALGL